jgi:hypothetical protein
MKRIARWYGAVMSVYAPCRTVYGWLHGAAGVLQVPVQDMVFNVLVAVGLFTLIDLLFGLFAGLTVFHVIGGVGRSMQSDPPSEVDRQRLEQIQNRAAFVVGAIVVVVLTVLMLTATVTDPLGNDFAMAAKWDEGSFWFFAAVGAAVLAAAYGFLGRRLLRELKGEATKAA